jgi:hypothetical protein
LTASEAPSFAVAPGVRSWAITGTGLPAHHRLLGDTGTGVVASSDGLRPDCDHGLLGAGGTC